MNRDPGAGKPGGGQRKSNPAAGARTDAQEAGDSAEDLAARYYEARGYRVLERKFATRQGELDLVLEKGLALVFAEVRFRRNVAFGAPEDTITPAKMHKVYKAALEYVTLNRLMERIIQFDVVSVIRTRAGPKIERIPEAFEAPM